MEDTSLETLGAWSDRDPLTHRWVSGLRRPPRLSILDVRQWAGKTTTTTRRACGAARPLMRGRGLRLHPGGAPWPQGRGDVSIPLMRGRGLRRRAARMTEQDILDSGLNPPDAGKGSATGRGSRRTPRSTATSSLNPPDAGKGSATREIGKLRAKRFTLVSIPLMRGRGLRRPGRRAGRSGGEPGVSIPLMRGRGLRQRRRRNGKVKQTTRVSIPLMRGRGLRQEGQGAPDDARGPAVSIPLMRGRGLRPAANPPVGSVLDS